MKHVAETAALAFSVVGIGGAALGLAQTMPDKEREPSCTMRAAQAGNIVASAACEGMYLPPTVVDRSSKNIGLVIPSQQVGDIHIPAATLIPNQLLADSAQASDSPLRP